MTKEKRHREYTDSQDVLADILHELGKTLIQFSERLRLRPELSFDRASLTKLMKRFRQELLEELEKRKPTNYDQRLKGISKETIIKFVKNYYGESIPRSWVKARVIQRAIEIFDEQGGLDRFQDMMAQFEREESEAETQVIDVYSMRVEEIKKVLGDIGQVGGTDAIKKALPQNLRYLLKGVRDPDYAIRKVVDQITRLRSPLSTFLEKPKK